MNRFAILYLIALFRDSYAPAAPTRERISRIKEARFVYHGEEAQRSTVFNDGNLHLYKVIPPIPLRALTVNFFEIGDNLETKEVFRMSISSTIVTKDRIMISFIARTITLILNENDSRATFALYQRLFPLGTFSRHFRVTRVIQDDDELDNVTAITARNYQGDRWVLTALNGNIEPKLIFTDSLLILSSEENTATKTSVKLDTRPEMMKITIEFDNSADADKFNDFVVTIV